MSGLTWKQDYAIDGGKIDDDHRELFRLINVLEESSLDDRQLADILARLEDYASGHFAREEEHMRDMGYPDLDRHVRAHRNFVEWLDTVQHTYRRSTESAFELGDVVNDFLKRWLTEHIMQEDMLYRDYARAQGRDG